MSESYSKAGIDIPPSYFIPFCHREKLSDLQSLRESAKGVSANSMVHCRKFGIPFSKFSLSKIKVREYNINNLWDDQDMIALFGILNYRYYNNTPAAITVEQGSILTGANLTTDFSNIKYPFDESKSMSIIHALYPIFGLTYDATNNPYAGLISQFAANTVEYAVNILETSLLGSAWSSGTVTGLASLHTLQLYMAFWNSGSVQGLAWTGTAVTADQTTDVEDWPAFHAKDLCIGSGVKGEEALDSCANAFVSLLYGSGG
jgi:hypothetical protein